MKRFLVIPLLFFYALAVSGITIHAHYCGKHLVSWGLYSKGKDCGGCEREKKSCCKDKVLSLKVSPEQKSVSAFELKAFCGECTLPGSTHILYQAHLLPIANTITHYTNAPPGLWQSIPLYKLNSSLTYYG